jgi:nucleotide-binding universal stress UspA family protein
MYRYKNILVGLSLEDLDDVLVRYAEIVSFLANSDRVRFVHVLPATATFSDLLPEYYRSTQDVTTELREHVSDLVDDRYVGPQHTAVDCAIVEGNPLAEMLRIAKEDDTDLVIVGRDESGGTLAEKLARKAPCSVLIVPPEGPGVIERVLVPVDFSDHAADAVDVAVAFAEAAGLGEVHLLHVYGVPDVYLKLGKNYDEFHDTMRRFADERYDAFVQTVDFRGLTPVPHFVQGEDVPRAIHEQAAELEADLVVVGTRGRSPSAAILLGSVGERVVRAAEVPVVAVKRKGATLGLIDALFDLQ